MNDRRLAAGPPETRPMAPDEPEALFVNNQPVATSEEVRPTWFAQDLIPSGRLCLLYGESGAGKGYLLAFLAALVAAGKVSEVFGASDLPSGGSNVLWASAEDDHG